MPSNPEANNDYSGLKKVRTGFQIARYAPQKLGETLLNKIGVMAPLKKLSDKIQGNKRVGKDETVNLNVGGQEVTVPGTFLTSKLPKGTTLDQVKENFQNKINNGERLLNQIEKGTAPKTCSVENMTDIMSYLQAKSQGKEGNFREGALSLPDPGGKIKNFLDTCPEAYQRKSSHLGDFQNQEGGIGTHRGIDAYGKTQDPKERLPNNMKTVMYGTMNKKDDLKMPEDRLWMKMESHGAWAFSPKVNDPQGPKRSANSHDGKSAVGHSLSFLETRGQGSKAGTRKERIPDDIKDAWNSVQEKARRDFEVKNPGKELPKYLEKGAGLKTAEGVRVINSHLDTIKGGGDMSPEVKDMAQYMQNQLKGRFPGKDLDVRVGNEVILDGKDMRPRNEEDIPKPKVVQQQGNNQQQGQHRVGQDLGGGSKPRGVGSLGEQAANLGRQRMTKQS